MVFSQFSLLSTTALTQTVSPPSEKFMIAVIPQILEVEYFLFLNFSVDLELADNHLKRSQAVNFQHTAGDFAADFDPCAVSVAAGGCPQCRAGVLPSSHCS